MPTLLNFNQIYPISVNVRHIGVSMPIEPVIRVNVSLKPTVKYSRTRSCSTSTLDQQLGQRKETEFRFVCVSAGRRTYTHVYVCTKIHAPSKHGISNRRRELYYFRLDSFSSGIPTPAGGTCTLVHAPRQRE